jgi:hypothetical protein
MEHPPLAFDAPQSEYLARVLNDLYIKNDTLLAKVKGVSGGGLTNGVTVTAAGTTTPPNNANYFVLQGGTVAAPITVNEFTQMPIGTYYRIKLLAGTILGNSAFLQLKDGVDRVALVDQYIELLCVDTGPGIGVWKEIGDNTPSVLDLSTYTGADIALCILQSTVYTITATNSLSLRIATNDEQMYSISPMPDSIGAVGVNATAAVLKPNNSNTAAGAVIYEAMTAAENAAMVAVKNTANAFLIDGGSTPYSYMIYVCTRTKSKTVLSISQGCSNTQNLLTNVGSRWLDTTVLWSSLGTMNWVNNWTGKLKVTRIL